MSMPDATLRISTMGRFCMTIGEKPVATDWPNETVKVLFCSLLSPLDLYFTWDRICRFMLGVPETKSSRRQLKESFIRPLSIFLIKELGFNPVIVEHEIIRIDQSQIILDAHIFYSTVVEALRLLCLGDQTTALMKFNRACSLYSGSYLPGMPGGIIKNTRNDLESLYQAAVTGAMPLIQNSGCSGARVKESDCECDHKE